MDPTFEAKDQLNAVNFQIWKCYYKIIKVSFLYKLYSR